jgi:anti-sigma factor (TIGR02949 family)
MPQSLTCKDAIEILGDFLDQTLTSDVAAQLTQHLKDCSPCVAYLKTYRRTRELVGRAGRVEMPAELRARLRRFLVERLDKNAP